MCTANFNEAGASKSFDNFKGYAKSKDGQAEISTLGIGLNGAVNYYFEAKSNNAFADYQRSIFLANSQALNRSSLDVVESARDQISWMGYQGKSEDATAINEMSSRGIDVNVGSAATDRAGKRAINQINIDNTRYNAMLQSFGLQDKALEAKQKADATKLQKKNEWAGALMSLGQSALIIYSMGAGGK